METTSGAKAQRTKRANGTRTISADQYRQRFAKRNKYHAIKTEYGGVTYDSKLEARFAAILDQFQKAGMIRSWTRQVPFRMPDGSTHRVDFMVFYGDDRFSLVEVKGRDLAAGRLKRAVVEEKYGVGVDVVCKLTAWMPRK